MIVAGTSASLPPKKTVKLPRRQHRTDVADPRRLRLRVLDSLHTGSDVLRRRAGGANLTGEGIQLFYPVEVGGIASGDAPGLDDLVAVRRACP